MSKRPEFNEQVDEGRMESEGQANYASDQRKKTLNKSADAPAHNVMSKMSDSGNLSDITSDNLLNLSKKDMEKVLTAQPGLTVQEAIHQTKPEGQFDNITNPSKAVPSTYFPPAVEHDKHVVKEDVRAEHFINQPPRFG